MSEGGQRLLEPAWLPNSLWSKSDNASRLPKEMVRIYRDKLDQAGLLDLANQRDDKNPPVGGLTQEDTDKHFAQQFDGSMARAQLVLLDPHNQLGPAADMLIKSLSGGRLVLVDIPCGAAAISCSFLSNIAQLREECVLPRLPLYVTIVGGEYSDPARAYAEELLSALAPSLLRQAIWVDPILRSWDALNPVSTSDLIREFLLRQKGKKLLVAIANFSSFLQRESKFDKAHPQLEELMRHCSGVRGTSFWIEPATNQVTGEGGLLGRFMTRIISKLQEWIHVAKGDDGSVQYQSQGRFFRALADDEIVRTNVALIPTHLQGRV
jgi:hypothetical protein